MPPSRAACRVSTVNPELGRRKSPLLQHPAALLSPSQSHRSRVELGRISEETGPSCRKREGLAIPGGAAKPFTMRCAAVCLLTPVAVTTWSRHAFFSVISGLRALRGRAMNVIRVFPCHVHASTTSTVHHVPHGEHRGRTGIRYRGTRY